MLYRCPPFLILAIALFVALEMDSDSWPTSWIHEPSIDANLPNHTMSIRANLVRLPSSRLDSLLASVDAWADLDYDLYELGDSLGIEVYSGGRIDLGFAELDKAWDALYFILDPARRTSSGSEPSTPAGAAVKGWHSMPLFYGDHMDYVPRYNTSQEVAHIAADLDSLDFEAAFNEHAAALHQEELVYGITDFDYLQFWFNIVRLLYNDAEAKGQVVVVDRG